VIRLVAVAACLAGAAPATAYGCRRATAATARRRLGTGRPACVRRPRGVGVASSSVLVGAWRSAPAAGLAAVGASLVLAVGVVVGAAGAVLVAGGCGGGAVARWAYRLGEGGRYEAAMVEFVDEVARRLRSGAHVDAALREVAATTAGPLANDLERIRAVLAEGGRLEDALRTWWAHRPRTAVGLVAGALAVGAASGGLRAAVVDDLALMLRQRDRARREALALAGQARASAVVMMIAPVVVAVVLAAGDGAVRTFLLDSRAGLVCLVAGLSLDLLAAAWMVRLTVGASWLR